jgi:hypothetical protein
MKWVTIEIDGVMIDIKINPKSMGSFKMKISLLGGIKQFR